MKKLYLIFLISIASSLIAPAQVLWVPGGTVGNNSPNSNVGIGTSTPAYLLHVAGNVGVGGDQQFIARYNGSESYKGTFGWNHLQLGNNGPNWIVAGRTATGGSLTFIVNNTADYIYNGYNGIAAMHLAASGNVGIGTSSPVKPLHLYSSSAAVGGYDMVLEGRPGGYSAGVSFQSKLTGSGALVEMARMVADGESAWNSSDVNTQSAYLRFFTTQGGTAQERLRISASGNVGIGTTNPTYKLAVNGAIRAKEVIVDTGWSDYVFADNYRLAPLSEVESHIKAERHLPGIPSAQEVAEHGVSMGEMQAKLLAKIEELTLHQIAQEKQILEQQNAIAVLRSQVVELSTKN